MDEMTGRVAVVTGAAQGIGHAIAVCLAQAGAAVALIDRRGGAASLVAADLASTYDVPAIGIDADVADETSVAELADRVERELGKIDTWVNNAGVTRPAMLHKMKAAEFDLVMAVHARGTFLGIREAARHMIESGTPGVILNVTSSAGLQGTIGQINYAAAKGAITAMTKSAARELARYGIRVNAVAPLAATPMTDRIRTDEKLLQRYLAQIPLGRIGTAEEAASAFAYLASPAAAYVTGQVLCIDGGLYMAS